MWRDGLLDPGLVDQLLEVVTRGAGGHRLAAGGLGEHVFCGRLACHVDAENTAEGIRHRYQPFLVALAYHPDRAGHAIDDADVLNLEPQSLTDAKAGLLDQLE